MFALATAIEKKNWELAALCLLCALAQALAQLPPDAIEGTLDALEGPRPEPVEGRGADLIEGKPRGRKKT